MRMVLVPTLFDSQLSDAPYNVKQLDMETAQTLFSFFQQHALFKWEENHNGCEARADAVCIILGEWGIPHYKAWVFSGDFLKNHVGGLKKYWNYHVAPLLPVAEDGKLAWYVMDPSTGDCLQTLFNWAAGITLYPHSYYFIKSPEWYNFRRKQIGLAGWYARDRQNRKWMLQGLAGVNGLSARGKAALCFNKNRIKNAEITFTKLQKEPPVQFC